MNQRPQLKDFVVSLSLANIVFLGRWSELLGVSVGEAYSMRLPSRPVDFEALMGNICLLGILLFAAMRFARRMLRARPILEWVVALFLVFPLNAIRIVLATPFPLLGGVAARSIGHWDYAILGLAGLGFVSLLFLAGRKRLLHLSYATFLVISPLLPITFGRAALQIARYNPAAYADRKLAAPISTGLPRQRVLWLIFDEMDQRLAFVNRRPGLLLPELDRFRDQSLYASQAYSPARHTLESMPSLITGRAVRTAEALAPDSLQLHFATGESGHFENEPNVFSRARDAGFDTALAGWYHPYCRVLNQSLTGCSWSEFDLSPETNSAGRSLPEIALNQARSLLETTFLSPFGQSLLTLHHVRIYQDVLAAGSAFAVEPRLGLVMIHFPIPHRPFIYDPATGHLDRGNSHSGGYEANLALADRTLGELRKSMQQAGVWDQTAVLISSDHGLRLSEVDRGKPDRWVPFLLHLPGQHESLRYEQPIQTILTADLLLELLKGQLHSAESVAAWLNQAGTRYAEPMSALTK